MNKWIEELKRLISDEEILQFYSEAVKELDCDDYDVICEELGMPSKIAEFETTEEEINVEAYDEEFFNINHQPQFKYLDLNAKLCNIEIYQSKSDKFEFSDNNNIEIIKKDDNTYSLRAHGKHGIHKMIDAISRLDFKNITETLTIKIGVPKNAKINAFLHMAYVNFKDVEFSELNAKINHCHYKMYETKVEKVNFEKIHHSMFWVENSKIENLQSQYVNHIKCDIINSKFGKFKFWHINHSVMYAMNCKFNKLECPMINHSNLDNVRCNIADLRYGFVNHSRMNMTSVDIEKIDIHGNHSSLYIDKQSNIKDYQALINFTGSRHNNFKWKK